MNSRQQRNTDGHTSQEAHVNIITTKPSAADAKNTSWHPCRRANPAGCYPSNLNRTAERKDTVCSGHCHHKQEDLELCAVCCKDGKVWKPSARHYQHACCQEEHISQHKRRAQLKTTHSRSGLNFNGSISCCRCATASADVVALACQKDHLVALDGKHCSCKGDAESNSIS
jgi:hypothetical protein